MSSEQRVFRLLVDGSMDGDWNMAVDEALLAAAHEPNAIPVLRWYQWAEPTLSLGYFQRWDDVQTPLQALPRVRRSTGGGAILHAEELTYSVAFPTGTWPTTSGLQIVSDVHAAAAASIQEFAPQLPVQTPSVAANPGKEPFLCFDRRSIHDLIVGADKIMGSAQRRQGGRLLQHGSIPLRDWDADALADGITRHLARRWNVRFEPSALNDEERGRALELVRKHQSREWTQRR